MAGTQEDGSIIGSGRSEIFLVGLIIVGLFLAQIWATFALIRQDRTESLERFIGERRSQLGTAMREIEGELDGFLNTLDMLVHFVGMDEIFRHSQEVDSVLRHQSHLHAVSIWSEKDRRPVIQRSDEVRPITMIDRDQILHEELLEEAFKAMLNSPESVGTSGSRLDSQGRVLRAFVRVSNYDPSRAVGILVDTREAFAHLKTLMADGSSDRVVLGPSRRFEQYTTVGGLSGKDVGVANNAPKLVAELDNEKQGVQRIDEEMARQLALTPEDQILTYDSLEVRPGLEWSVGILTSLEPVRASARSMMWRVGGISGVFSLLLLGFGGFLVHSIRRRGRLEERLEHTREIARLHAKSDAILDAIPTGVAVVDEDLAIIDMNNEMASLLGDEAPDEPIDEILQRKVESGGDMLREAVAREAEMHRDEANVLEPVDFGAGAVHFQLRAVQFQDEQTESTILAFHDVTEVKRLESQLLRAEKLATVGVLAAGVAHEIGTPLGVVRGRVEYALTELDEDAPARDHLEIVLDQIDYVGDIVRQLLNFSRVEEPDVQKTDLEATAEKALQLVTFHRDGSAAAEVSVDIDESVPPLAANPDELQQVLVNLLVNANQASEDEVHIELRARAAESGPEPDHVAVTVRDDGEGIEPEDRHQIFDPFFTTKKRGKGTGLGLSIVQKIVRNHGGSIDLESRVGVGTAFTIRWPTYRAASAESRGADSHSHSSSIEGRVR